MMASSVMLRAASMPDAARSASCQSSMKAMHERSGSSLITSRTAAYRSRQALVVGITADDVLHGEPYAGTAVIAAVQYLEWRAGQRFQCWAGLWMVALAAMTRRGSNCAISSLRFYYSRCSR